jgi:hypothetical protein
MNDELKGFARVAPYLSDPLVLVGFALLLLFLLFRSLIGSGLIPVLEQDASGRLFQSIADYGFYAIALVIVLGFAHAHFRRHPQDAAGSFRSGKTHRR